MLFHLGPHLWLIHSVASTEHLLCSSTSPGVGNADMNQLFRDHLVGTVALQNDPVWYQVLWGLIQNSLRDRAAETSGTLHVETDPLGWLLGLTGPW